MTLEQEMLIGRRIAPLFLLVVGYFVYKLFKKEKYNNFVDKMYKKKG